MTVDFDGAGALFAIAASAVRLRILSELANSEMTVGQLGNAVGIAQSALSQHLRRLREANLVFCRRRGANVHYRLAPGIGERLLIFAYKNFEG